MNNLGSIQLYCKCDIQLNFQFEQFMSDHPADSTSMEETYSDIHFYIQANIRWQIRNADELNEYFDNQPGSESYRLPGNSLTEMGIVLS